MTVADVWSLTIEAAGSGAQIVAGTAYAVANAVEAVPLRASGFFRLAKNDTVICYVTRTSGTGNYVEVGSGNFCYFQGRQVL
jgi:hypothetical protein